MVLGSPTNKCSHSVYAAGETRDGKPWARNCSMCNDNLQQARACRRTRPTPEVEQEIDVAAFMERPVGERLASLGA